MLAACAVWRASSAYPPSAQVDSCSTQVIVGFSKDHGSRPPARFVSDLASSDRVRLRFLRTVGPGLYLFSLRASEQDCSHAIERLRRDARVRSVDLNRRRTAS
ncbi:MAG TPA: hypothetical protein VMU40_03275 [Steroidobacteraceae bacterium]|nr:hypothetical protein [Steroidobacteraceae bacterium]